MEVGPSWLFGANIVRFPTGELTTNKTVSQNINTFTLSDALCPRCSNEQPDRPKPTRLAGPFAVDTIGVYHVVLDGLAGAQFRVLGLG